MSKKFKADRQITDLVCEINDLPQCIRNIIIAYNPPGRMEHMYKMKIITNKIADHYEQQQAWILRFGLSRHVPTDANIMPACVWRDEPHRNFVYRRTIAK